MNEIEDIDFVNNYLTENFHHGDILDRIRNDIAVREKDIEKLEKRVESGLLLMDGLENLEKEFENFKKLDKVDEQLETYVCKIKTFQNGVEYLKLLEHLKELNDEMNIKASEGLTKVLDDYDRLRSISEATYKSSCLRLRTQVVDPLVKRWHEHLQEPILKLVDEELNSIGYPFDDAVEFKPKKDLSDLQRALEVLYRIDLPEHLTDDDRPPLPIKVLLNPLNKKFRYYFYSATSKLNDCTKPEYYFGVVLKWMNSHRKFLENYVEELFADFSPVLQFNAALLLMSAEKVKSDLKLITEDDVYSHLIDEILSYDNVFLDFMPELVNYKRPINMLSNDCNLITRWIQIEVGSAAITMDSIIQSDNVWKYNSDKAAVDFLDVIQLTTRRCRKMNPSVRLQFYLQELEIIENFRLRLNQVFDDTQSHEKISAILNTVQVIHSSMTDWEDVSPYNKILSSSPEYQCKHDDAVRNLQNLSQNIIRILVYNAIDSDVCSVLDSYKTTDFIHIRPDDLENVSGNFVPILSIVELHLQQFNSGLLDFVARNVIRSFAARIDAVLCQQVFEPNYEYFEKNEYAMDQVRNDIENCLFPLFQVILPNPSTLFPRLKSFLLSANKATD